VGDVGDDEEDRCRNADPWAKEQQGRDQRIEDRQARPVDGAGRGNAAIIPPQAVSEKDPGVVKAADQKAGGLDGPDDGASPLHLAILSERAAAFKVVARPAGGRSGDRDPIMTLS
jgi:hypothetical protein